MFPPVGELESPTTSMIEDGCPGVKFQDGGKSMDEILKNLGSPAWWFTGFFFIIGALVVGYLKDRFIRWLARSSEWYRRRKAASLARKEEEIERLVSEPLVLILLTLRSAIAWMF